MQNVSQNRQGAMRTSYLVALIAVVLLAAYVSAWRAKWFARSDLVMMPATLENPPSIEELTKELAQTVDSVSASLESINDEATANQSLQDIEEATQRIIGLKLDRLPGNYQANMMVNTKPMVSRLVGILKKLYKLPGVQAIVEPAISPLLSRLQAFANVAAD